MLSYLGRVLNVSARTANETAAVLETLDGAAEHRWREVSRISREKERRSRFGGRRAPEGRRTFAGTRA